MPVNGTSSEYSPGVTQFVVEPYDLQVGEKITIRWTTGTSVVVEHTATVTTISVMVEELVSEADFVIGGATDGQWDTVFSPVDFGPTSLTLIYPDTSGVLEVISTPPPEPENEGEVVRTLEDLRLFALGGEDLFGFVNTMLDGLQSDIVAPYGPNEGQATARLRDSVLFSDTLKPITGSVSTTLELVGFHAVGGNANFGSVGDTLEPLGGTLQGRSEVQMIATLDPLIGESFGGQDPFGHRGFAAPQLEPLGCESTGLGSNRSQLYLALSPLGFGSQGGSGQFGAVAASQLSDLTVNSQAADRNTGIVSGHLGPMAADTRGESNKRVVYTTDWRWFSGRSKNCLLAENVLHVESPCSAVVLPLPIRFTPQLDITVEKQDGTVNVTLEINRPHIEDVTVTVQIVEQAVNLGAVRPAVDGEDFVAATETVTITTGNTTANIPVDLIDNPLTTDSCWFRIVIGSVDTLNVCLPEGATEFFIDVVIEPPE